MDGMTKSEFEKMKKDAERRILEMAKSDMPPYPSFVRIPDAETTPPQPPLPSPEEPALSADKGQQNGRGLRLLRYLNLPEMLKSSDSLLLLSLILLLSSEEADETLILALAYILL